MDSHRAHARSMERDEEDSTPDAFDLEAEHWHNEMTDGGIVAE